MDNNEGNMMKKKKKSNKKTTNNGINGGDDNNDYKGDENNHVDRDHIYHKAHISKDDVPIVAGTVSLSNILDTVLAIVNVVQ